MEHKIDEIISILQDLRSEIKPSKKNSIISKIENSESKKELSKFSLNDLKKYCKINEIEIKGLKPKYINAVWKHIEDQYEWYYSDDDDDDEETQDDESDDEYED
jgi:hypothetical protein